MEAFDVLEERGYTSATPLCTTAEVQPTCIAETNQENTKYEPYNIAWPRITSLYEMGENTVPQPVSSYRRKHEPFADVTPITAVHDVIFHRSRVYVSDFQPPALIDMN